ncbi:hypothetical protein [Streptomyces sennicomposti]
MRSIEATDGQLMGGVMKLGKALATGVARERQQPRGEEESPERPVEVQQEQQPRTPAPEEVPAAR